MKTMLHLSAIGCILFGQSLCFADTTPAVAVSESATSTSSASKGMDGQEYSYVGECFTVHGRAQFYNGNPTLRIWIVGTHKIIGISDYRCSAEPENLSKILKDWGTRVYGDFTICPLSKYEKGHMQFACIQSVKIAAVEHLKGY